MIYIVGTHHELQHSRAPVGPPRRPPSEKVYQTRLELMSYLRRLVGGVRATILAEEMSQPLLDVMKAVSHIKAIADELNIKHRLCDPDPDQRTALGIPWSYQDCPPDEKRKYDALREAYWARALSNARDRTVIFVCGADHVSSFAELLRDRGVEVSVACAYFGHELYGSSR
jgi:hypothetical protein